MIPRNLVKHARGKQNVFPICELAVRAPVTLHTTYKKENFRIFGSSRHYVTESLKVLLLQKESLIFIVTTINL